MLKRIWERIAQSGQPESLMSLMAPAPKSARPVATTKLYVLRVDFPLKQDHLAAINGGLQPLREKFGLDFLVLEPGITLQRFDDF